MTLKTSLRRFYFIVVGLLPFLLGALVQMAGLAAVSGCSTSGASAPPVSLPAPPTGRLTVTSPDESGLVTVVGDDGAVPARSLVHVANATQDTTAFRGLEFLLSLTPSAYAQSPLPPICSRTFHACAFADDNGAFEVSLPASDDHDLIIEIIDSDGHRISERLHRSVPHNVKFFARPVTDLGILDNTVTGDHSLYVLMGHTDTAPNGQVSVVNLDTQERTLVPFDGPLPARIAVDRESRKAVVLDPDGGFAARVDLTTNGFDTPTKLSMALPRDVALTTDGSAAIITTNETIDSGTAADARFIRSIIMGSFTEGDPIRMSQVQVFIPGAANIETRAVDISRHTPFGSSPPPFDLGAVVGIYDVGGIPTPGIGLFNANTLIFLAVAPLPSGTDPVDVAFIQDSGDTGRLMVSDTANDRLLLFSFISNGIGTTITPAGQIDDPSGFLLKPRRIVVNPERTIAFVTAKNGTDAHPDTVLTVDLSLNQIVELNPIGFGPSGEALDLIDNNLFVGTLKSNSVTFIGLSDLLP